MLATQLLINGIALGSLYALAAVGLSLIFWTTRVFHIAHGGAYVVAAYVFIELLERFGAVVAVLGSLAAAVAFGYGINRFVYRPIQRSRDSFFTLFVASFGALIVVSNLISILWGSNVKTLEPISDPVQVGSIQAPSAAVIGLVVAIVFLAFLQMFLAKSETGVGLRAMADNAALVDVLGLNRRRFGTTAFVIGSAMVVPAAILTTYVQGVQPTSGLRVATIGLVVSIAGGVGSLSGAVVGGVLLGVVENVSILWVNPLWAEAVGFSVLLAILVVRPTGIIPRRAQA